MKGRSPLFFHAAVALLIIAAGIAGFMALKESRPEPVRAEPAAVYPMVRTVTVSIEAVEIVIAGEGTIRPASQVRLISRVGGEIMDIAPGLADGGTFEAGQPLVRIEDADYRIALSLARAEVTKAESRYETVRQEAQAAVHEWRSLYPEKAPPPLAAKKPQLEAARAGLEAARAKRDKARLDLERTTVSAPFCGRTIDRAVSRGQFVAPGTTLGTIYDAGAMEIVVPLESRAMQWFSVPGYNGGENAGTPATVTASAAGQKRCWPGKVLRVRGAVDPQTRMTEVVVGLGAGETDDVPPFPGEFARVRIHGKTLSEAAVIPHTALRDNNTVWIVDADERLRLSRVEIAWRDERGAVVPGGLSHGDRIVVSPLLHAVDGMRVRFVE